MLRVLLPFVVAVAGCSGGTTSSSEPETPTTSRRPAEREGDFVGRPVAERKAPPPRVAPVAAACRGAQLDLDAELSACACSETEYRVHEGKVAVRLGDWCGLPHPNERSRANVDVTAERTELAPGEGTTVRVRVTNPGPETSVYRVSNRHLSARLVLANGRPFPDAVHSSGAHNDEAHFELPPGGTMELRVPVSGTYSRWVGTGESAAMESAKLAQGGYGIEVFLGGLGGERSRVVAIRVR